MTIATSRLDRATRFAVGATPIRITDEGYKVYEGTSTMGNVILPYTNPTRLEFRPESEATSESAIESMEGVPITNDHPSELLTPDTVKEHTEGAVLKAWLEDGPYPKIKVRLIAYTRSLQDDIEAGKVELSPGYNTDPVVERGEHEGRPYDVVQRNVRYNHLAVVDQARTVAPNGDVARLDKDDTVMDPEKITGEAGNADANDKTRTDAARKDGLSDEGMALLAKMPEEDQKMIESLMKGADKADEVNVEIESGGEEEEMESENMDMQAQMDKLKADMAALMGRGDSKPAPSSHRLDAAKIIERAEAKAREAAEKQTATLLADRQLLANAGVRVDGFGSNDAFAAMLAEIKTHTPDLYGSAERALKGGRLDDVRDLFNSAAKVSKESRSDANAEEIGEIFTAPAADAPAGLSANVRF